MRQEKKINLDNQQAQNWRPEGTFLSLIEQPPKLKKECDWTNILVNDRLGYVEFIRTGGYNRNEFIHYKKIKLPFAVGDIVYCLYNGKLIAIVEVTDTQVERVQEIPSNIKSLLIDNYKYMSDAPEDAFKQWFNDKFAKPGKTKDGYVCYPYDLHSWAFEYCAKEKLSVYDRKTSSGIWKGEQLTIYANPYFEPWRYKGVIE